MTNAYDDEFLLLCEFLAERLSLTVHHVQINVACVGLRMVRRILSDVNIHSSSDGIECDTSVTLELYMTEDWLKYRLEAAWKMIMRISRQIIEKGEVNRER